MEDTSTEVNNEVNMDHQLYTTAANRIQEDSIEDNMKE